MRSAGTGTGTGAGTRVVTSVQRRPLLEALARYAAWHADEAATVARFQAFVAGNARCFERSLLSGHVTGSAWLVDPPGRQVLLTRHRKLGIWVQLGGHADGDPDTLAVARREAEEESGLAAIETVDDAIFDLDIHLIPARASEPAHFHYDVRYLFRATKGTRFRVSSESSALAWVPVDSLADTTTPSDFTSEASMLRMALKWQTRTRV